MPREQLEEWERVLRALPGVVDTKIVHNDKYDGKRVGLRDQVLVTHLRDWTE